MTSARLAPRMDIRCQTLLDTGLIPTKSASARRSPTWWLSAIAASTRSFHNRICSGDRREQLHESVRGRCSFRRREFKAIHNPLLAYDGSQRASSAMESAAEFCTATAIAVDRADDRPGRTSGGPEVLAASQRLSRLLRNRSEIRNRARLSGAKNHRISDQSRIAISSLSAPTATGASSKWCSAAPRNTCCVTLRVRSSLTVDKVQAIKVQGSRLKFRRRRADGCLG